MRRVNIITYDLIKDKYGEFLKDIKPEDKGRRLNVLSSESPKWEHITGNSYFNKGSKVIFKQFRIR